MIKICTMKFTAELAVHGKFSTDEIDELRKAIETVLRQRGCYANFMIGMNTIEIKENKDASK